MSQNREVNICSDCGYVTVLIARNHFSSHMCRYTHTQHRKNIKMTPDAQFTWSSTGVIVACKRFERNEKQTQTRTADSCLHNTIDQGITASMWWSACDVRCSMLMLMNGNRNEDHVNRMPIISSEQISWLPKIHKSSSHMAILCYVIEFERSIVQKNLRQIRFFSGCC